MEVNDILKASWLNRKNFSKEYNQSEKCDLNIKKRKKNTKKKSSLICLCVIQSKICLKTNKACKYVICRFLLNGKKVSYD